MNTMERPILRDRKLSRFLERRASNYNLTDEGKVITNFEEAVFTLLEKDGKVRAGALFKHFEEQGIRRDDPRLKSLIETLTEISLNSTLDCDDGDPVLIENLVVGKKVFIDLVKDNRRIISKTLRTAFVLPEFKKFSSTIRAFHKECKEMPAKGLKVFDRIPQTAKASPDMFGVAICSIDGQRLSAGDSKEFFLLGSISNALMYAVARSQIDADDLHEYVGQEPSGRDAKDFALDQRNRPHNPMIDPGAIMVASIIQKLVHPELKYSEIFDWVFSFFKRATAGVPLRFNNAAFIANKEAADGNFAQAFYMREMKSFPKGAELSASMDLYLQCQSMEATCETLAIVAATLANGGINPLTEETVFTPDSVTDTLSLMHSCGLKQYSGHFAFEVGMPAKSGASGAIMVVVPNVLGFCVWSPPVDQFELSLKGLRFCEKIVRAFPFHHFDNVKSPWAGNKTDPCRTAVDGRAETVVALLFSAASGDATAMRRFFMSGMDMTISDYDGRSALHLAAAEGHAECVDVLIHECAMDPNVTDRWGQTPLDDAKLFDNKAVAKILEEAGGVCNHQPSANSSSISVISRQSSVSSFGEQQKGKNPKTDEPFTSVTFYFGDRTGVEMAARN